MVAYPHVDPPSAGKLKCFCRLFLATGLAGGLAKGRVKEAGCLSRSLPVFFYPIAKLDPDLVAQHAAVVGSEPWGSHVGVDSCCEAATPRSQSRVASRQRSLVSINQEDERKRKVSAVT